MMSNFLKGISKSSSSSLGVLDVDLSVAVFTNLFSNARLKVSVKRMTHVAMSDFLLEMNAVREIAACVEAFEVVTLSETGQRP